MNLFKPRYNLIQFSDGTYGVLRTFWFYKSYVDLDNPHLFWGLSSQYFYNCKGFKDRAEKVLALHTLTYKILDNPS